MSMKFFDIDGDEIIIENDFEFELLKDFISYMEIVND